LRVGNIRETEEADDKWGDPVAKVGTGCPGKGAMKKIFGKPSPTTY